MAPLKPCEGPCFIPWGKEGWGCAGTLAGGWQGRISPSKTRILVLRSRGSASSHASEQGTKGCVHQKPAQATPRNMPFNTQVNPRPWPKTGQGYLGTRTSLSAEHRHLCALSPLCLLSRCLA